MLKKLSLFYILEKDRIICPKDRKILKKIILFSTLKCESNFSKCAPVLLKTRWKADWVVRAEETFLAEGVEVERAAVVSGLGGALGAALLNVVDPGQVGVREGEVGPGLVQVLAVGRHIGALIL